jgi:sialate O-acetylesterase
MTGAKLMNGTLLAVALASTLAILDSVGRTEVKLNGLFSEGMVLQQGIPVPVWGTAQEGEKVIVKLQGQEVSATARHGQWIVRLNPLKAGGPFTMQVSGKNTITRTNVLVGEVWLCSGQSNMEFPLAGATNAAEVIPQAGDPGLRFFTVPHGVAGQPVSEVAGVWKESAPETVSNFSAVAWFFGRDLRRALSVPVGLIHSSVSGAPAEAWTAQATLASDPALKPILQRWAEDVVKFDPDRLQAEHMRVLEQHKLDVAKARAVGKKAPRVPPPPENPVQAARRPAGLYNAMLAPLQPYAIAGVIWYQGEANCGRGAEYRELFPAMIRNWRKAWGQGDFPFLFVQIAPYKDSDPEIREAQLLTWRQVPRTAMAVITDFGDETHSHPTQKKPVGARLALAARAVAYGQQLEYSGPVYESLKLEDHRAVLSFSHLGGGLVAKGGPLKGFTIAGEGGNFVTATAEIAGDKVVVSSASVAKPVAVRYGWTNTPDVNLFNRAGLPATPFRTGLIH